MIQFCRTYAPITNDVVLSEGQPMIDYSVDGKASLLVGPKGGGIPIPIGGVDIDQGDGYIRIGSTLICYGAITIPTSGTQDGATNLYVTEVGSITLNKPSDVYFSSTWGPYLTLTANTYSRNNTMASLNCRIVGASYRAYSQVTVNNVRVYSMGSLAAFGDQNLNYIAVGPCNVP